VTGVSGSMGMPMGASGTGITCCSPVALDDYLRAKAELPLMARSLVEGAGREIQRCFLNDEAAPYVPCPAT